MASTIKKINTMLTSVTFLGVGEQQPEQKIVTNTINQTEQETIANFEAQSRTWTSGGNNQPSAEEALQEFIDRALERDDNTGKYEVHSDKLERYLGECDVIKDCKSFAIEGANSLSDEIAHKKNKHNITLNNSDLNVEQVNKLKNSSFGRIMNSITKDPIDDFSKLYYTYKFLLEEDTWELIKATKEIYDYLFDNLPLPYLVLAGFLNYCKKYIKNEV